MIDWRRTPGSPVLTDKQVSQMPALLRDLADCVEALTRRLEQYPPVGDVCFFELGPSQICGVRRRYHDEFMGTEHGFIHYAAARFLHAGAEL